MTPKCAVYSPRVILILMDLQSHPQKMTVISWNLIGSWTWYHKDEHVGELSNP